MRQLKKKVWQRWCPDTRLALSWPREKVCVCVKYFWCRFLKQALVFSAGLGSQQNRMESKGPFAFLSSESIYCRTGSPRMRTSAASCTRAVVQRWWISFKVLVLGIISKHSRHDVMGLTQGLILPINHWAPLSCCPSTQHIEKQSWSVVLNQL